MEADVTGHSNELPTVGLGGSAGSISALQTFFKAMPADSGMAFVVILHLSPEHESTLAEVLQHSTSMPVRQVNETEKVEANHVYVIPPAKALTSMDGQLRLSRLQTEQGRRAAIDLFFRTLADTHGPRASAIVLSGADSDGALGVKRIKERGGLTIAQDPDEALHREMPSAAIATGMSADRAKSREAGYRHHLVKPYGIEQLPNVLREAAQERAARLAAGAMA